jgi:hypothetical protein
MKHLNLLLFTGKIFVLMNLFLISGYAQWGTPHNLYYPLVWKNLKSEKPILDDLTEELKIYPDKNCYMIFYGNKSDILKIKKIVMKYLTVDKHIDSKKLLIVFGGKLSEKKRISYEIWFVDEKTKSEDQIQFDFSTLMIFPRNILKADLTFG